jgi:hypothetical protein
MSHLQNMTIEHFQLNQTLSIPQALGPNHPTESGCSSSLDSKLVSGGNDHGENDDNWQCDDIDHEKDRVEDAESEDAQKLNAHAIGSVSGHTGSGSEDELEHQVGDCASEPDDSEFEVDLCQCRYRKWR